MNNVIDHFGFMHSGHNCLLFIDLFLLHIKTFEF